MKGTMIKMIGNDMKFYEAPVKELREDFVFSLVRNGQMSVEQFAAWVESVRDEWFLIGLNSSESTNVIEEDEDNSSISPQAITSEVEFF